MEDSAELKTIVKHCSEITADADKLISFATALKEQSESRLNDLRKARDREEFGEEYYGIVSQYNFWSNVLFEANCSFELIDEYESTKEQYALINIPLLPVSDNEYHQHCFEMVYMDGDSPWNFCLGHLQSDSAKRLQEMLTDSVRFGSLKNLTEMPIPGDYVIYQEGNRVYRAVVQQTLPHNRLTIFDVDTCAAKLIRLEKLYAIDEEIASIHCQALNCYLFENGDNAHLWQRELQGIFSSTLKRSKLTVEILGRRWGHPTSCMVKITAQDVEDTGKAIDIGEWVSKRILPELKELFIRDSLTAANCQLSIHALDAFVDLQDIPSSFLSNSLKPEPVDHIETSDEMDNTFVMLKTNHCNDVSVNDNFNILYKTESENQETLEQKSKEEADEDNYFHILETASENQETVEEKSTEEGDGDNNYAYTLKTESENQETVDEKSTEESEADEDYNFHSLETASENQQTVEEKLTEEGDGDDNFNILKIKTENQEMVEETLTVEAGVDFNNFNQAQSTENSLDDDGIVLNLNGTINSVNENVNENEIEKSSGISNNIDQTISAGESATSCLQHAGKDPTIPNVGVDNYCIPPPFTVGNAIQQIQHALMRPLLTTNNTTAIGQPPMWRQTPPMNNMNSFPYCGQNLTKMTFPMTNQPTMLHNQNFSRPWSNHDFRHLNPTNMPFNPIPPQYSMLPSRPLMMPTHQPLPVYHQPQTIRPHGGFSPPAYPNVNQVNGYNNPGYNSTINNPQQQPNRFQIPQPRVACLQEANSNVFNEQSVERNEKEARSRNVNHTSNSVNGIALSRNISPFPDCKVPYGGMKTPSKLQLKTHLTLLDPNDLQAAMVSYIVSPDDFYVHFVNKNNSEIDDMECEMESYYSSPKNPTSGVTYETKYCACKYVNSKNDANFKCQPMSSWFRAEVINFSEDEAIVFLVDYGKTMTVHLDNLKVLEPQFFKLYKIAQRCHLNGVNFEKGASYTDSVIEYFQSLVLMDDNYKMTVIPSKNSGYVTSLSVVMHNYRNTCKEPVPSINDKVNKFIEMKKAECNGHSKNVDMKWNPMAEEFESEQNNYRIDTGDPVLAVTGYKQTDDERICKFYRATGACWKKTCKKDHERPLPGYVTSDKRHCYNEAYNKMELPVKGAKIRLKITHVISGNVFFAHLVKEEDMVANGNSDENEEETFGTLIEAMNEKGNINKLNHLDIYPTVGEIVVARSSEYINGYQYWFRARVESIDEAEGNCTIFCVDFGTEDVIPLKYIREIVPQYLHLPFQAVECRLAGISIKDHGKAFTYFKEMVDNSIFYGEVHESYRANSILEVYLEDEDGYDLGIKLMGTGYYYSATEGVGESGNLPG